jgi:hypothetical protein
MSLLEKADLSSKSTDEMEKILFEQLRGIMVDPNEYRRALNIFGRAGPELAPLNFISMWHEREPRYPPVSEDDYWDPHSYTAEKGLIKLFPELLRHAKRLSDSVLEGSEAALRSKRVKLEETAYHL